MSRKNDIEDIENALIEENRIKAVNELDEIFEEVDDTLYEKFDKNEWR